MQEETIDLDALAASGSEAAQSSAPSQEVLDLDALTEPEQSVIDLDALGPTPQVEPVPVPTPGPDVPPQAAPQVEDEGSIWNRISEAASGAAATVLTPVFKGITKVADTITGTTQQEKDAEAAVNDVIVTQVNMDKNDPSQGKRSVPSWHLRMVANEEARDLRNQQKSLTPKQKQRLVELDQLEEIYSKASGMPMPRPPKTPNSSGGLVAHMTDEEVAAIATQYGADPGFLLSRLSQEGIKLESSPAQVAAGEDASTWAGAVGGLLDAGAFGAGKFLDRAMASAADRRALEAIRKVAASRFGGARMAAEIATGIGPAIGISKALGVGATKVAAVPAVQQLLKLSPAATADVLQKATIGAEIIGSGATFGALQADKGKAVEGALQNAVIVSPFLGAGPAFKGAAKAAGKAGNVLGKLKYAQAVQTLPHVYEQAVLDAQQNLQPAIGQMIVDAQQGTANAHARTLAVKTGLDITAQTTDSDILKHLFDTQMGVFTKAPGQTEQVFRHLLEEDNFNKIIDRTRAFKSSKFGRLADTFSAAVWPAMIYDGRHGTNGAQIIDRLASDARSALVIADKYATKFEETVSKPLRRLKKTSPIFNGRSDEEATVMIYDMIDKGTVPPELQGVAKGVADFFEDVRLMGNNVKTPSGMPIIRVQQLKGGEKAYVPHMAKQGIDRIVAIQEAVGDRMAAMLATQDPSKDNALISNLKSTFDSAGVTKVLSLLDGQDYTNADVTTLVKAYQRNTKQAPGGMTVADSPQMLAALEKRMGGIPEWFREKNLLKVTGRYVNDILDQVFSEPHMRDAEQLRNYFQKAGDTDAERFWTGWIKQGRFGDSSSMDALGYPGSALKEVSGNVELWARTKAAAAERAGNKIAADNWKFAETANKAAIQYTRHNMYSYFLGGANVKALVENAVQPLTMGIPQLGTTYGTSVAVRALSRKLPPSSRISTVAAMTYESSQEMQRLLKGQLQKQGILGKAAEKASTLGLLLFNATEKFSRQWGYKMGVTVAEDLLAGKPSAVDFVKRMPGSYGRNLERLVAAGDTEGVERMMTDYLVGRISLNYSKESQSEFAKSLGPILNAFSRWPSETVGILNESIRGGAFGDSRIKRMAAGPAGAHTQMLTAMLLSERLYETAQGYEDATKESRMYNLLTGGKGVGRFSVLSSAPDVISTEGKYKSPVAEALGSAVLSAGQVAMDPEDAKAWVGLQRAADTTAGMLAPGLWLYKLVDTYDKFRDDDMERRSRGPIEQWANQ